MASHNFIIGHTQDGKPLYVDPFILSDTRALICASSGLGKSWLLRLISEWVASKIQTIIIDPAGEFPTLREKLDILVVAQNGDIQPDIRSAGLLARRLCETGVSAVIDIYDLPGRGDPWDKRRLFVGEFLNSLMNVPKSLYHPMLIKIDEAHNFAPEGKSGGGEETAKYYIGEKIVPAMYSLSAVNLLMSGGRKYGFGGLLATQRVSKINKDSIADARNKFIGGTTLDNDQRRAGDELGFTKAESVGLRDLDPGEFYCYGPAIQVKGIARFTSAQVKTTHPKAGQRSTIVVPKASTHIKAIMDQLGDIPAEAEAEIQTMETLKNENTRLKRDLANRPVEKVSAPPEIQIEYVDRPILTDEQIDNLKTIAQQIKDKAGEISSAAAILGGMSQPLIDTSKTIVTALSARPTMPPLRPTIATPRPPIQTKQSPVPAPTRAPRPSQADSDIILDGPQQRVLDAIAWLESLGLFKPERSIAAFLAGYKNKKVGSYRNALSTLKTNGFVNYPNSKTVELTNEGRARADAPPAPRTTEELQSRFFSRLPGPETSILKPLIDAHPDPIDRETLAQLAGYKNREVGSYRNALSRLKTIRVIDYPDSDSAVALPILFLEQ